MPNSLTVAYKVLHHPVLDSISSLISYHSLESFVPLTQGDFQVTPLQVFSYQFIPRP